jgi:gluconolactonase
MPLQFEKVAGGFGVTEGPVWDGTGLLFTDIPAARIMRFDPKTGACTVYKSDTHQANGLRMEAQGRIYACEGGGRRITRYEKDGSVAVLADRFEGKRFCGPNDLAIDSKGRIWFTDPHYDSAPVYGDAFGSLELDHQSVYRLDPAAGGAYAITRVTFDTTKPNGILVSPDETTLYVAQSAYGEGTVRQLRAYPIKPDGTLGTPRVLHDFGAWRGIDGMKLDSEGNIVATAGALRGGPGPMIYVFAPDGAVLEANPFPEDRPTNCAFGDDDMQTLYVTNFTGSLHRARTQRKGLAADDVR